MAGGARDTFLSQLKQLVRVLEQEQPEPEDVFIPATVFSFSHSPLQSLVAYLKDTHHFSLHDIAEHLHRSYSTVYAAYKRPLPPVPASAYAIPLDAFAQGLSVLEACVVHLKKHYRLRFSEIARLLHKDPRTIWSTYDRTKKQP